MPNQFTTEYTTKYYIDRAKLKHGEKYDYSLVLYTRAHDYIFVTCPKHGNFKLKAYSHLNGQGCKQCWEESKVLSKESFIKRCKKLHNNFYSYPNLSLTSLKDKISIVCPIHGTFKQEAGSHIHKGSGCFECKKSNQSNTKEELISRFEQIYESGLFNYSLVDYKNLETPITVICTKHGKFLVRPDYFLRKGGQCKKCKKENASLGERRIIKILSTLGYNVETQVRFKDCKDKNCLPFDVGIIDPKSNKRIGLIEFQGRHHYQESFGKYSSLGYVQKHDIIKKQYCQSNDIPLLEIPYYKNNLQELIENFIGEN